MEILGLHYAIWIVLVLYFIGMIVMGWWAKRGVHNQESFLLGDRQFGVPMMVMQSFGTGTHPGDVAGVMSHTVLAGGSGIWVSWMWMFGTPIYWIIAPVIRRMRCLTMADFFQERFGKGASILYIIMATIGMVLFLASALLATSRTVQGMMGKAVTEEIMVETIGGEVFSDGQKESGGLEVVGRLESEMWFFGILFFTAAVFMIYGFWGGLIAAVRTDMVQGLMIIALSFLAIPAALRLNEVGGLAGMRATLGAIEGKNYLTLFDPGKFNLWAVILLCINAPLSMLAQPHIMSLSAAGKTEWEGRVGFTYGALLKRVCTMGWCVLGLCWLAYLLKTGSVIHPDAAFGDSVRYLLNPLLQGLMLACVLAAAMSSGSAVQVCSAGLFSQNIYRVYINPDADEWHVVRITRWMGVVVVIAALITAALMRHSVVKMILDFFNFTAFMGISIAMGILWRRMNSKGVYVSTFLAIAAFILTRYGLNCPRAITIGVPLALGIFGGIFGSLFSAPPSAEVIENLFRKIHVPIGHEDKLELPLDKAVPRSKRLFTGGGLFLVKPTRQSWVGMLVALGLCLGCIWAMLAILRG